MSFVLDASVALSWCFRDEGGAYALKQLERLRVEEAFVPALWTLEISNALLVAERRGRMEAVPAMEAMDFLLSLPIAMDPPERARDFSATYRLARTHGLSSYDAAYLELALRLRIPLATLDAGLRKAAKKEGVGAG
ncbi:MAG: type II toxin-antitoxin system VapC family toxin [Gemmatimonadota bacterium]